MRPKGVGWVPFLPRYRHALYSFIFLLPEVKKLIVDVIPFKGLSFLGIDNK